MIQNRQNSNNNAEVRHKVNQRLRQTSDGIDMDAEPTVLSSQTVYQGAIFHVDDMRIALNREKLDLDGSSAQYGEQGIEATEHGGLEAAPRPNDVVEGNGGNGFGSHGQSSDQVVIRRQVVRHAGSVVMLSHDTVHDLYLIEREYRVGSGGFVYGLPAGLIDGDENIEVAALRELREETGIEPVEDHPFDFETIASCYLSEGMSSECSNIMAVRMGQWRRGERHFDPDEHVQSAWVNWDELAALEFKGAQVIIALQYEQLRRLRAGLIS
ncbi:NUDIX hydrolase [Bifidobacterium bohemicum]|uniref:NUDIX hydrolase n=1 Tax=Bifidobacterium bohemicum TaxID=638617 RepID=UPI001178810A|nr:NUDIX hydrolase [Bifidobacterium bohemicum]